MNEPSDLGRSADAAKEIAKTTSKAIDAGTEAGKFFSKVMGDLITDGIGLVGDRVRFYRIERAVLLAERTDELLKGRNVKSLRAVAPNIALPIIEAAASEADDEIHLKWAELLAQAMDPDAPTVDRRLITTLSALSPSDMKVFDVMSRYASGQIDVEKTSLRMYRDGPAGDAVLSVSREEPVLSYAQIMYKYFEKFDPDRIKTKDDGARYFEELKGEEVVVSLENLVSLGLVMTSKIEWTGEDGERYLDDSVRTARLFLTDFGRRFASSTGYLIPDPKVTYYPWFKNAPSEEKG
ncbi:DUF4393 domain-containing protein [Rhodovulum sp. 12E13]|uniref:Abi-alpha family protein n=1 Tax=Rhodovulum sp. 12E13 TaxID=2203891 RepID=UPI000E15D91D|nr:Abi-alpha family protein [Rhodovulum sp. 12E13]RDC67450.1 DUF4393 domain-containing protein [Rhodovulum sp. 12E13]